MTQAPVVLTPMAHVSDVARSIAFYERLGFVAENTHKRPDSEEIIWAWLRSLRAQLMLAKADAPVSRAAQGVLFYVYVPDVDGYRDQLIAAGVDASEVTRPFYAPRGEFRVTDPDGYVLMVTHT